MGKSINDYLQHKSTPYSLEEPEKSLVYLLEGMEDGKEFVGLHYDFSVFEVCVLVLVLVLCWCRYCFGVCCSSR